MKTQGGTYTNNNEFEEKQAQSLMPGLTGTTRKLSIKTRLRISPEALRPRQLSIGLPTIFARRRALARFMVTSKVARRLLPGPCMSFLLGVVSNTVLGSLFKASSTKGRTSQVQVWFAVLPLPDHLSCYSAFALFEPPLFA